MNAIDYIHLYVAESARPFASVTVSQALADAILLEGDNAVDIPIIPQV